MKLNVTDRAIRGHTINLLMSELGTDVELSNKSLRLECLAFEGSVKIPAGTKGNLSKSIKLLKSTGGEKFYVYMHADNKKQEPALFELGVHEPAVGFAKKPVIEDGHVCITLKLQHSLTILATVIVRGGCLKEGGKAGTWEDGAYKIKLLETDRGSKEIRLPLNESQGEADLKLTLEAVLNCEVYDSGKHGVIENFEPELIIECEKKPLPIVQFSESAIIGDKNGDNFNIGTVEFTFDVSAAAHEDNGPIVFEIHGDHLVEQPLTVTIPVGKTEPNAKVTGTLIDTGLDGEKAQPSTLFLKEKGGACTIGKKGSVTFSALMPTVSLTSDADPKITVNESSLNLEKFEAQLKFSYQPKGLDVSVSLVCGNLNEDTHITMYDKTPSAQIKHTFLPFQNGKEKTATESYWKEESQWREDQLLSIQADACILCRPHSKNKAIKILSPLRLSLSNDVDVNKSGIYGKGTLDDGTIGFYRGPFFHNDIIQFEVKLNRISTYNEYFKARVFIGSDKVFIIEKKDLSITAGDLKSGTQTITLDHASLEELQENVPLYISLVSVAGGSCGVDDHYHDLLRDDDEEDLQKSEAHPLPQVTFHQEHAIHYGPDKTTEEGRNKKYNEGDPDSYHYTLLATAQKLVLCLSEASRQQEVVIKLHNKKHNAMKTDNLEVRIPPGRIEYVTPSINFRSGNRLGFDSTKQLEIIKVSACRIGEGIGKNQPHILRIQMLRDSDGAFYFTEGWITPSHSAAQDYSESGEAIPLVAPHDQIWIQVTRDDEKLSESKSKYYVMCDALGDKVLPVVYADQEKVSEYICLPGSKHEKGMAIAEVKKDKYKLRFYRKRSYRTKMKLEPSEKKVEINGEPFILTKIIDTQYISVSRRWACFTPDIHDVLKAVIPGQKQVAITLRLTVPAGPMTWLKLIPGAGATTCTEYYVPIGLGETQVEQSVDFQEFKDHSAVSFKIEVHNGAVETVSTANGLSESETKKLLGLYPDIVGSEPTTIAFNPLRPIEETLFKCALTYTDQKDTYDGAEVVGQARHDMVLSLRLQLSHPVGAGCVRQFTLASEAFPMLSGPDDEKDLGFHAEDNKDGNHPYDKAVLDDLEQCKKKPTMVAYSTKNKRCLYTVTICSPTIGEGDAAKSLTEIEVNVRVAHPAGEAALTQPMDEVEEGDNVLKIGEWETRDSNEKRNLFLIKILEGDPSAGDLTLGKDAGVAIQLAKVLTVSVGRDLDQHSDDMPWIEPDQRTFASGDPARIWMTCSEKPKNGNAICTLVSPIIVAKDNDGRETSSYEVPVEFSTTDNEKFVDVFFDIMGTDKKKYTDWAKRASRFMKNVWQDHKMSTLFLEQGLTAVGDGFHFKGAVNPLIDTEISLLHKRYVTFRKSNHFAESGPFRMWEDASKLPLDAPPIYIHLSVPAPLGGCKVKIIAGKKATFLSEKEYTLLLNPEREATSKLFKSSSLLGYQKEHKSDEDFEEHDFASVEKEGDIAAIVTIPQGVSIGIIRVAFTEDSVTGGGTIKLEAVENGYCHLHKKSNRNVTLDAIFGKSQIDKVLVDRKCIPQLGAYAIVRVELKQAASRGTACFVKADKKYWDKTPVQFACGDLVGRALVLIKEQPTDDECENGLDIELEEAMHLDLGGKTKVTAKILKVIPPEYFSITAIQHCKSSPSKEEKKDSPQWEDHPGFKAKGKMSLTDLKVGDKLRFTFKRTLKDDADLNYTIRGLNCGATVFKGVIPPDDAKRTGPITRDIMLTVSDSKAHELVFHKPGTPALILLHPDQSIMLKVAEKEKLKKATEECAAVKALREKEAKESGLTFLEPKVIPLKQPCYLHSFELSINYGDITDSKRDESSDRKYTITQDSTRAKEEGILVCTDKNAPIIQVVSGPPTDQLFTSGVTTTKKWKFFGDKTKSIVPDAIHFKGLTVQPNPGDNEEAKVNHFCEDVFDFITCKQVHNHPIVVIAERQMTFSEWEAERKLMRDIYDLSVMQNQYDWRKALDKGGPAWNPTEKNLLKVESELRVLRSELASKDQRLNDDLSARLLTKTDFPPMEGRPFPDKDEDIEPADGEYSSKRRMMPSPIERQSWDYLRPMPAPNGVRTGVGGVETCKTLTFPIFQAYQPWTAKGRGFIKGMTSRKLEDTPPQQYYIGLNACGKPNPEKPDATGTVSNLQAVVEVYPSDECYIMIGIGAPPENNIHHLGAAGTHFNPAQDFDPSQGFDAEFKKGIKSISTRARPGEEPNLAVDGKDLIIRPPDVLPSLTIGQYQGLGEAARRAREEQKAKEPIPDAGSSSLLDKVTFRRMSKGKTKKNPTAGKIASDFVYYAYDHSGGVLTGRKAIEYKKTSKSASDTDSLKGFENAWDSAQFDGDGAWEDTSGGGKVAKLSPAGQLMVQYLPRIFSGRNGNPERGTDPGCSIINSVTTVVGYLLSAINLMGGSGSGGSIKAPTMGFGFNVKIKVLQGEYMRYWGWKEASDHRVFYWKYQNFNVTLFDITLEMICGIQFKVAGVGISCLLFASIGGACNARSTFEEEPPTLTVSERRDWNKNKDRHIDCDITVAGGLRAELVSEYLLTFKGQIEAKMRFRFDITNDFRLNIYNGGVTVTLEISLLTKKKEKMWILIHPDSADTPTKSLGSPGGDPNSMHVLESILSRIQAEIDKGCGLARDYLMAYEKLQLNMYSSGGRNALTVNMPLIKTAQDGDEWDHNKLLWNQQWKELSNAFSAEKHKVRGRNSIRWYVVSERLKAKSQILEDIIEETITPMVARLRQAEIDSAGLQKEFARALEEFDKPDQANRKRAHSKAIKILKSARKACRSFKPDKFDDVLRDFSFYARERKHW